MSAFERWIEASRRSKLGQAVDLSLAARQCFNELKADREFSWVHRYCRTKLGPEYLGREHTVEPKALFTLLSFSDPTMSPYLINRVADSILSNCGRIQTDVAGVVTVATIASRCGSLEDLIRLFEPVMRKIIVCFARLDDSSNNKTLRDDFIKEQFGTFRGAVLIRTYDDPMTVLSAPFPMEREPVDPIDGPLCSTPDMNESFLVDASQTHTRSRRESVETAVHHNDGDENSQQLFTPPSTMSLVQPLGGSTQGLGVGSALLPPRANPSGESKENRRFSNSSTGGESSATVTTADQNTAMEAKIPIYELQAVATNIMDLLSRGPSIHSQRLVRDLEEDLFPHHHHVSASHIYSLLLAVAARLDVTDPFNLGDSAFLSRRVRRYFFTADGTAPPSLSSTYSPSGQPGTDSVQKDGGSIHRRRSFPLSEREKNAGAGPTVLSSPTISPQPTGSASPARRRSPIVFSERNENDGEDTVETHWDTPQKGSASPSNTETAVAEETSFRPGGVYSDPDESPSQNRNKAEISNGSGVGASGNVAVEQRARAAVEQDGEGVSRESRYRQLDLPPDQEDRVDHSDLDESSHGESGVVTAGRPTSPTPHSQEKPTPVGEKAKPEKKTEEGCQCSLM